MYQDRNFFIKSSGAWLVNSRTFLFVLFWALNFHLVQSHKFSPEQARTSYCSDASKKGHRLNATVYDDRYSLSRIDCVVQCVTEPCCRSINYRKRDPFNGKENCELLHAVASEQPAEDLKEDKDYDYEILLEPNKPFDCHCSSCKNNGSCETSKKLCSCGSGFNGTQCEKDVDECNLSSNRCHQNSTCKNSVGSYTCTCNQGFTKDGINCTDVDECNSSSNLCHQNSTCKNTVGSYTCTCNQGFTGNGINCTGTFVANFTNLGASGRFGPTSLGSFYAGQDHENMVTVVNGIQYWTVPFTGTYQITAVGASGGYDHFGPAARGRGAYMKGDFDLNKGEVIKILVGQQGVKNVNQYSAGGGGGTFVVTSSNKLVIIAGGGGGIEYLRTRLSNCDASVGTSGKKNQCVKTYCSSWSGGVNGSGALEADNGRSGGGGGGFYSNGRSSKYFGGKYGYGGEGGKSFLQGGAGGRARRNNAVGGFGGGAGAYGAGFGGAGGGGGYSGGASGNDVLYSCAGGGGSYNSGRNQENSEGFQDNGHGYVEINRIFPDV